jgi:hypothetical protein
MELMIYGLPLIGILTGMWISLNLMNAKLTKMSDKMEQTVQLLEKIVNNTMNQNVNSEQRTDPDKPDI